MTDIHKKILYFFSPNALAIKAPPIGERMTGVRNETPKIPYLLHTLTFLLFATVNSLRFLPKRGKTLVLKKWKNRVINTTLIIIPKAVAKAVSILVKPRASPSKGPKINFTILETITVRYFRKGFKSTAFI